jgi:Holliday junction resolvasome RuvABC endonuclease subunit
VEDSYEAINLKENEMSENLISEKKLAVPGVLCIDAGFANCGWVVIQNHKVTAGGVIVTKKTEKKHKMRVADDDVRRCQETFKELYRIYLEPQYGIKYMLVELPSSGGKSSRAVSSMARAQAVVACLSQVTNLPTEWVTPRDLKLAVCNSQSASKEDIEAAVMKWHPEMAPIMPKAKSRREHVTDAVGAFVASENTQLGRIIRNEWEAHDGAR